VVVDLFERADVEAWLRAGDGGWSEQRGLQGVAMGCTRCRTVEVDEPRWCGEVRGFVGQQMLAGKLAGRVQHPRRHVGRDVVHGSSLDAVAESSAEGVLLEVVAGVQDPPQFCETVGVTHSDAQMVAAIQGRQAVVGRHDCLASAMRC
jgi:hypothetical protein